MRLIDADVLRRKFAGGDDLKSIAESICDEIFVSAIDAASTINPYEWISVEDRLPEDGDTVVTYSVPNRRISHCECLKSYVTQYGNYAEITHWMPLPALPTIKENNNESN